MELHIFAFLGVARFLLYLDMAKLFQRVKHLLVVLHLDRVYYLLYFVEDIVVLDLYLRNYVFPLEKDVGCCTVVEHPEFLLVKSGLFEFDDDPKGLALELCIFFQYVFINFQGSLDFVL